MPCFKGFSSPKPPFTEQASPLAGTLSLSLYLHSYLWAIYPQRDISLLSSLSPCRHFVFVFVIVFIFVFVFFSIRICVFLIIVVHFLYYCLFFSAFVFCDCPFLYLYLYFLYLCFSLYLWAFHPQNDMSLLSSLSPCRQRRWCHSEQKSLHLKFQDLIILRKQEQEFLELLLRIKLGIKNFCQLASLESSV